MAHSDGTTPAGSSIPFSEWFYERSSTAESNLNQRWIHRDQCTADEFVDDDY